MIAILLMVFGGLLSLISVLAIILFVVEPLYKRYMIVIKRKDDYTYYNRPEAKIMLKNARKEYLIGAAVMLIVGVGLFLYGYYLRFGERGLNSILAIEAEDELMLGNEPVQGHQAEGINYANNYVAADGTEYIYYFVVKGTDILYRNSKIEENEIDAKLNSIGIDNVIYLVDSYASSKTFKMLQNLLDEKGFSFKIKE